jgi:hypothetical protein
MIPEGLGVRVHRYKLNPLQTGVDHAVHGVGPPPPMPTTSMTATPVECSRCGSNVLHQVADAGDLLHLVAGAGPDPDSKGDASRLRQGLGEDPQAPGKVLSPNVRIGH